jgi:spermidine synthase
VGLFTCAGFVLLTPDSGVGAGVAPTALRKHGISTTIVEIDPAVYDAARTYFGLPDSGEGKLFLEDARGWVHSRQAAVKRAEHEAFDIVIHDCFSGGGVPSHIFTLEFWQELRDVVKPDGVVAVVSHPALPTSPNQVTLGRFEELCRETRIESLARGDIDTSRRVWAV